MCAAPKQGQKLPAGVDVEKETVLTGQVTDGSGNPVAGAFVRLLDSTGEFTAEVPTSATSHFRFFAGDGSWTLRTLAPGAQTDRQVVASRGNVLEVDVLLDAVAA